MFFAALEPFFTLSPIPMYPKTSLEIKVYKRVVRVGKDVQDTDGENGQRGQSRDELVGRLFAERPFNNRKDRTAAHDAGHVPNAVLAQILHERLAHKAFRADADHPA